MLSKKNILSLILIIGAFPLSNVSYAMDFGDECSNSGSNFVDGHYDSQMEISPLVPGDGHYLIRISDNFFNIDMMAIGGKAKVALLQKAIVGHASVDLCTRRGSVTSIKIKNQ